MENSVTVINLGVDDAFDWSGKRLENQLNEYQDNLPLEHRYIKKRSLMGITRKLMEPTQLLHVMAHGNGDGELDSIRTRVTRRPVDLRLDSLIARCEQTGQFPIVDGLILDACTTFTDGWISQLERLVPPRRTVVFIGTTGDVKWQAATAYTSSFYAALLRTRFPSTASKRRERLIDAHERARIATEAILGTPAPFEAIEIMGRRIG